MAQGKGFISGLQKDQEALHGAVARQKREQDRRLQEDVVIDGFRQLKLRSPNGHYWAIEISNAGVLSGTDLGTSL